MRKLGLTLAGLVAVVAWSPSAGQEPYLAVHSLEVPAVQEAAADFGKLCAPCHGAQGKGDGPMAVAFNPKPGDFTDPEYMGGFTDEQLTAIIADGKAAMPAFGKSMTPDKVQAMVAYVRSLSQNRP